MIFYPGLNFLYDFRATGCFAGRQVNSRTSRLSFPVSSARLILPHMWSIFDITEYRGTTNAQSQRIDL